MPNGYWNAHSDRDWEDQCGMFEEPPSEEEMAEVYGENNCGELTCWPAHQLNREIELRTKRQEWIESRKAEMSPREMLESHARGWDSVLAVLFGGGR